MREIKSKIFKEGRFLINIQYQWLAVKKLFYELDKENKYITHLRLEGKGDIHSCETLVASETWSAFVEELIKLEEQKDKALVIISHMSGNVDLTVVPEELTKEIMKTWDKEKIDSIRRKGDAAFTSYIT